VLVFVDEFNLATIAGLRYARAWPHDLRAVHFVIDSERADELRQDWLRAERGIPLDLVECPDRRVARAAGEFVAREASQPDTYVTVVLPRRSYATLFGRLMHDQTADKIARVVSRIRGPPPPSFPSTSRHASKYCVSARPSESQGPGPSGERPRA